MRAQALRVVPQGESVAADSGELTIQVAGPLLLLHASHAYAVCSSAIEVMELLPVAPADLVDLFNTAYTALDAAADQLRAAAGIEVAAWVAEVAA